VEIKKTKNWNNNEDWIHCCSLETRPTIFKRKPLSTWGTVEERDSAGHTVVWFLRDDIVALLIWGMTCLACPHTSGLRTFVFSKTAGSNDLYFRHFFFFNFLFLFCSTASTVLLSKTGTVLLSLWTIDGSVSLL